MDVEDVHVALPLELWLAIAKHLREIDIE